ncbi:MULTISPECIES: hypothetical protein [Chelatococcus]|uniref:hypothetical protein n=1 Tax=Chelatococcus TaxID=28209 RepID=UPI0011473A6B|nr:MULTISPECIES: hypothetical protein [Chelatococcus]
MAADEGTPRQKSFDVLASTEPTKQDQQIEELQKQLAYERDARREDRFVGIVCLALLLNVVFFSVMPNFGGPIALLVLELLILIPLAQRMGMQEIAQILNRVLHRMASRTTDEE